MNASELLQQAHLAVHQALDALPDSLWDAPNGAGEWSPRQQLALIAAHEQVLAELLASFTDAGPTPTVQRMRLDPAQFDADEVAARAGHSPAELMAEYDAAHARTVTLIADIAPVVLAKRGTLPWFGEAYALDDYLVYRVYGLKIGRMALVACVSSRRDSTGGG
jgi:hypothetical protein